MIFPVSICCRQGSYKDALKDYSECKDHSQPNFFDNRAVCHARLGQWLLALNNHAMAIQRQPTNPLVYYHRAHTYYARGEDDDFELALADFDRTLSLATDADNSTRMQLRRLPFHRGVWYDRTTVRARVCVCLGVWMFGCLDVFGAMAEM